MAGRERERAELAAAIEPAERGNVRAVLLLGEPGMGKSTLADAVASVAREQPLLIVLEVGRAWAVATTSGIFPMCEPVPMPTIE